VPNRFNAGNHCGCCGQCFIGSDDFNRSDRPIDGDWYGDGNIVDEYLDADHDSTTLCHPAAYTLGSLYGTCVLKDCDTTTSYVVRLGDPNATPDPIEVWVTFSGTMGVGTGTMLIELRLTSGVATESYEYDWEYADEELSICYVPGLWLCARPTVPRTNSSSFPLWVTTCLGAGGDDCWTRDGETVGNWMFVTGRFDDWYMEVHYYERRECSDCDCYCVHEDGFVCIPKEFSITVGGTGCLDDTYTMRQKRVLSINNTSTPTVDDWPEKATWISDEIACPGDSDNKIRFMITCNKDATYGYPRLETRLIRYGGGVTVGCSSFQFEIGDPGTVDTSLDNTSFQSYAYSKSGSTCDPLYLVLPDIIEQSWACSNPDQSCCGGYIVSGDPGYESPPFRMSVVVTE
jgi:hypothetical protein